MTGERWACLMYHKVPPSDSAAEYFAVPRGRFDAQLDCILTLGLTPCSLEAALDRPAEPCVALTFDDGDHSHYREVFPALLDRRLAATFFVTSSWVGTPGYVTWDELREMSAAGMSIQSHTATHPFLSECTAAETELELTTSKAAIEEKLGLPCATLSLPGGDAPRGWRAEDYARIGFRCVATSLWGPNQTARRRPPGQVAFVRRYTVRDGTPMSLFESLAKADQSAYSREGLRLTGLSMLRSMLGATRYQRLRRRFLNVVEH